MALFQSNTLGRNEPCHCGSGKKYKQCHLAKDEAAQREAREKQEAAAAKKQAAEAEAEAAPEKGSAKPAEKPAKQHNTQQPWKTAANPRGFTRVNVPRRSGGS